MMEQNSRPGGRGIRRPAARARACRPSPGSPSRLFLKAHRGRTRPARRVSVWDYVYRCQDQVGEELAARGFVLDGGYVRDLHQGQ